MNCCGLLQAIQMRVGPAGDGRPAGHERGISAILQGHA